MKFLVLSALIAAAFAAPEASEEVEIEKAQMPFFNPMMGMFGGWPWQNQGMFQGMYPQSPDMYPQNPDMFNDQEEYPIDYSQPCNNQCNCKAVCVPWVPCRCRCPPPCPTVPPTTTPPPPLCKNGAPDWTYPWCCTNGATNQYCCTNGANNQYCCTNGANNPTCTPDTTPPPTVEPTPPCKDGGCGCIPCMPCMPCMIWWMCNPCRCNNGCQTKAPTTTAPITPAPPLCTNGAPDWTFPWCCHNGATNQYCCTNGANNPTCTPPTPPPVEPTTTTAPCRPPPCQCPICIPWFPCSPCRCQQPNPCPPNSPKVPDSPQQPDYPLIPEAEEPLPPVNDPWNKEQYPRPMPPVNDQWNQGQHARPMPPQRN